MHDVIPLILTLSLLGNVRDATPPGAIPVPPHPTTTVERALTRQQRRTQAASRRARIRAFNAWLRAATISVDSGV